MADLILSLLFLYVFGFYLLVVFCIRHVRQLMLYRILVIVVVLKERRMVNQQLWVLHDLVYMRACHGELHNFILKLLVKRGVLRDLLLLELVELLLLRNHVNLSDILCYA